MHETSLILDCDGVIVDSEIVHLTEEIKLLGEMGLHYEIESYTDRFMGLAIADFHAKLTQDFSILGLGHFPNDVFQQELDKRAWARIEDELQIIPGLRQLVDSFPGPIAVASSSSQRKLHRKLSIVDMLDSFLPHVYSADDVHTGKPAPDLFLLASRQLGVNPQTCVVVEDSVNGILAAKSAGMKSIGFTGGSHIDDRQAKNLLRAGAVVVFDNHFDIGTFLQST
jgi:HAD superfamily hydrolase (TIGR01509 family)